MENEWNLQRIGGFNSLSRWKIAGWNAKQVNFCGLLSTWLWIGFFPSLLWQMQRSTFFEKIVYNNKIQFARCIRIPLSFSLQINSFFICFCAYRNIWQNGGKTLQNQKPKGNLEVGKFENSFLILFWRYFEPQNYISNAFFHISCAIVQVQNSGIAMAYYYFLDSN